MEFNFLSSKFENLQVFNVLDETFGWNWLVIRDKWALSNSTKLNWMYTLVKNDDSEEIYSLTIFHAGRFSPTTELVFTANTFIPLPHKIISTKVCSSVSSINAFSSRKWNVTSTPSFDEFVFILFTSLGGILFSFFLSLLVLNSQRIW